MHLRLWADRIWQNSYNGMKTIILYSILRFLTVYLITSSDHFVSLYACGQCGPSDGLPKDFGINYLALNDLFSISTSRQDVKYDIRVQMVEIYNEQVRDLLGEDTSSTKYPCTSYMSFLLRTMS